jgi:hypothetical protein
MCLGYGTHAASDKLIKIRYKGLKEIVFIDVSGSTLHLPATSGGWVERGDEGRMNQPLEQPLPITL